MIPTGTPERDAALAHLLAEAAADADVWSVAALRRAAGEEADLLFPDGAPEMVEAWYDLCDRALLADAAAAGTAARTRVPDRVREAILLRLPTGAPHRNASRRALVVLARPGETARAGRVLARTADAIWRAAGDTSTGLSRHTRRATVGAVWSATLLYALGRRHDGDPPAHGDHDAAVAAFLDRRLAGVARIARLRRWLGRAPGQAPLGSAAIGSGRSTPDAPAAHAAGPEAPAPDDLGIGAPVPGRLAPDAPASNDRGFDVPPDGHGTGGLTLGDRGPDAPESFDRGSGMPPDGHGTGGLTPGDRGPDAPDPVDRGSGVSRPDANRTGAPAPDDHGSGVPTSGTTPV